MNYLILFAWSLAAASVLPISSEPYFFKVVLSEKVILIPLLIASIGNIIGGISTFCLGKKGGEIILNKLSDENKSRYNNAVKMVNKYGPCSLLLSWVPFIGDVIVAIGGALKLPLFQSIIYLSIGKVLRFFLIALIAINFVS